MGCFVIRDTMTRKKKNGRPTKYTPEVLDRMGKELLAWFAKPDNLWLKDFALTRGFHWSQFTELAEKSESFSHALKVAKGMQESKLLKIGPNKDYNQAMAIFALKNVAGWRDTQDVTMHEGVKIIRDNIT